MTDEVKLPWRVTGLDGFRSDSGPTYDGGSWSGGGPRTDKHVAVRFLNPYYGQASVEFDLGDGSHGCTVSLTPDLARDAAAALLAAADKADAELAHWRSVLDANRQRIDAAAHQALLRRAGMPEDRP